MGRSISTFLMVGVLLIVVTGVGWADTAGDLARAGELAQGGQYDAAIGLLSGISTSDPALASRVGTLLAQCYLSTKNSSTALAKYQELIKDYPNATQAAEWNRGTAECYVNMSKFSECFVALDKAIELASDPAVKRMYRGDRAFILMAGSRKGDLALIEYQALLKDYPDAPAEQVAGWYRGMGECYVSMKKLREGRAAIDKAIELVKDPATKIVYRADRAYLLVAGGQNHDFALAEYQALLNDYPDAPAQQRAGWYRGVAECYVNMSKLPECFVALDKAIELAQDPAVKMKYRGDRGYLLLFRGQEYDRALAEYQALANDDSQNAAQWRYQTGLCYALQGQYAQAIEVFREVMGNYRSSMWAGLSCRQLAIALAVQGKTNEALAFLDKSLSEKPDWRADILCAEGHVLYEYLEDHAGSVAVFSKLVADYPDSDPVRQARWMISWSYELTGRVDDAVAFTKSMLAKYSSPDQKAANLEEVAAIYYRTKRYSEAASVLNEELKVDGIPSEREASAVYNLGLCHYQLGDVAKAQNELASVRDRFPETQSAPDARAVLAIWSRVGAR